MKGALLAAFWLATAGIALAQAPVTADQPGAVTAVTDAVTAPSQASVEKAGAAAAEVVSIAGHFTDGTFLAKLLAIFGALLVLLRGMAEGLTRISTMTSNTWDNKLANWLSDAAWFLGAFLGKFGYGEPAQVAEEKAKAASTASTPAGGADGGKPAA